MCFYRTRVFEELGVHSEAVIAYNRVLEINPKDAHAWLNKGLALKVLGRFEESEDSLKRAKEMGFED